MDARLLHSMSDALKVAGCSIGEDYVPVLYNSLIQLQSENHFDAVYLWGRVATSANDYYVAYGHQTDPIMNRIFFYTQNVLEWTMMPTDWPASAPDIVCKIKSKFTGNVRHVEEDADGFERLGTADGFERPGTADAFMASHEEHAASVVEEEPEYVTRVDSDVIDEIMSVSTTEHMWETDSVGGDVSRTDAMMIKEEDRLALTVQTIDNECHVVPRGFFYRLPDGRAIKAPYFKGLSYSEIGNPDNFLHINPRYRPNTKNAKDKVRGDYNASIDFLESIDKDLPKGCWSYQKIMSNRYVTVRSLLWPGAAFVQDMNTGLHGFFYNGDGVKNLDVVFMI